MDKAHLEGPLTAAERREMAADQQRPEFRAWLADMDRELNLFFTEDIPDLPCDPYTVEGLRWIEQFALADFWDEDSQRSWRKLAGRIARYYGELLVRDFEGRWEYIDVTGDGLAPVIKVPFRMSWFEPAVELSNAMARRSGEFLPAIYKWAKEDHIAWNRHGRLSLREWVQFQSEQRRGLI